jgi:hypothetical protein
MVNYAFQPDDTPITLPDESEKLSTKIKLSEVMEGGDDLKPLLLGSPGMRLISKTNERRQGRFSSVGAQS